MIRIFLLILIAFPAFAFAEVGVPTVPEPEAPQTVSLLDSLTVFINFIENGIYEAADSILERVAAWYIIWNLELKIFWLKMALSISEGIVSNIGISSVINSALGGIDSSVAGIIFYLRIPEALNMILSASVARMILSVL